MSTTTPDDSTTINPSGCRRDGIQTATLLNNTAVAMLQGGSFWKAAKAFEQATLLLKGLVAFLDEEISPLHLQGKIDQAKGFYFSSCACNQSSELSIGSPPPTRGLQKCASSSIVECRTVSSEYDPCSFFAALASTVPTRLAMFPFTIDLSESEWKREEFSSSTTLYLDYYSSIILYNYGVAFDCLAATASNAQHYSFFQKKAFKMFHLASKLLEQQLRDEFGHRTPTLTDGRALQLQAFVTHKFMQVCALQNLPMLYNEYNEKLQEIIHVINVLESLLSTNERCAAMA